MRNLRFLALVCVVMVAACGRVDFGVVDTENPYVGQFQGKDCAVLVDQVQEGNLKGRIYLDEGELLAKPFRFSADLKKNGNGSLKINGDEIPLTKVKLKKNQMQGVLDSASFSLVMAPNDDLPFKSQYKEPCYEVASEQGRVYARDVQGYWKKYRETNESFAVIYLRKTPELVFKKSLDLDMDLYYPEDQSVGVRHPLLLLIHGGAFYNGDKQSIGYPEMGRYFAERGFVVASINYRMGFGPTAADVDRAGFRGLQDAHAAVCYLLKYSEEYRIDPDLIFVAGTSAGAITALNLAFMQDDDRPDEVLGEGTIDAVSGDMEQEFQVKAVANMWGAVRDLSMLYNSPETSIISFHGDEDHVVPYEYGFPFDGAIDLHVDNVLSFFGRPSVSQLVFNPMQGSKCIHDKAQTIKRNNGEMMRSELHTVHGESIYHLHVDNYGRLTDYFYDTILPATTRFFCEELVGGILVELIQSEHDERWFEVLGADNEAELHWQVEGGVVVRSDNNKNAKILYFEDAPMHSVAIGGKYKNGVGFFEKSKTNNQKNNA